MNALKNFRCGDFYKFYENVIRAQELKNKFLKRNKITTKNLFHYYNFNLGFDLK